MSNQTQTNTLNPERIYLEAAAVTGRTPEQLREMAQQVFASMLYHAGQRPGKFVWTVVRVGDHQYPCIDCNVDMPGPKAQRHGGT